MGGRIRSVVIIGAIFGIAAFFVWYVVIHRPSADVTNPETTQDFTDSASLTGTSDNPAELDGVVVCNDGIRLASALATSSPTPSDSPAEAVDSGLTPPSGLAVDTPAADEGDELNQPTSVVTTEGTELTPLTEPAECQTPLTTATTELPLGDDTLVPPDPTIELKYRLEAEYGLARPCGGPVEIILGQAEKASQFATIAIDQAVLAAFLDHLSLANDGAWTDAEKAAVFDEFTRLSGVTLHTVAGQETLFILPTGQQTILGTISASGQITKTSEGLQVCPLCLAATTEIETPLGPIRVTDLAIGSPIWTEDGTGHKVAGEVVQIGQTPAPVGHQMVNLQLLDGRAVLVSPGHPTVDGRTVGDLGVGERYDGSKIISTTRIPYDQPATHDILPSGPTGFYWADGVKLGSTLLAK